MLIFNLSKVLIGWVYENYAKNKTVLMLCKIRNIGSSIRDYTPTLVGRHIRKWRKNLEIEISYY